VELNVNCQHQTIKAIVSETFTTFVNECLEAYELYTLVVYVCDFHCAKNLSCVILLAVFLCIQQSC